MPFGILEPAGNVEVAGTCLLTDDPNQKALDLYKGVDVSLLKHGKGKYTDTILVPQPSDDPNDPLNWPAWKKHTTFFTLCYGTVLCGVTGPLITTDLLGLSAEFHVAIQTMSKAFGTAVVAPISVTAVLWSLFSVTYGKRPTYLASTLILLIGSLVAGEAKTYSVLLGGRILQGTGRAVLEFLVGSTLADIYFLHERGIPIALWTLALQNGINITPPIASQVVQQIGFRWCFRIFSISIFVLFVLQIFFMPETLYKRKLVPHVEQTESGSGVEKDQTSEHSGSKASPVSVEEGSQAPPQMMSYIQSLRIFSGRYNKGENPLLHLWQPFALLASPTVLWAIVVYGTATTWLICVATAIAQIFAKPPYKFTNTQVGLTYMSPFIFSTIAALLCGPLTDYVTKKLSKKNNGVFEPEFKLPLISFYLVFAGMGFFGWAISANMGEAWIGPVMFFGLLNFGIIIGCSAAVSYVVECHRTSSDSALAALIIGKNLLASIFTSVINNWIDARGILSTFSTIGAMVVICSLFTIPMYIYGKRARLFIQRRYNLSAESPGAEH